MRISMLGALFFGVLGIVFSFWTNSQAILLDGAFNLVSALTIFAAIKIGNLLQKPETEARPAGFVALEPFYVAIRGLIIFALTIYVVASNVVIALGGGNELQLGVIVIYLAIAMTGNYIIYFAVRKLASKAGSPMLTVEKENWMVNAFITSGIGVSLLIVFLFQDSFIRPVIPYADQIVVIAVGIFTLGIPIRAILGGMKELLLFGAEKDSYNTINDIVKESAGDDLLQWKTFILKTGRKYWISLFAEPGEDPVHADWGDQLKKKISPLITDSFPIHNLDIIITKEIPG